MRQDRPIPCGSNADGKFPAVRQPVEKLGSARKIRGFLRLFRAQAPQAPRRIAPPRKNAAENWRRNKRPKPTISEAAALSANAFSPGPAGNVQASAQWAGKPFRLAPRAPNAFKHQKNRQQTKSVKRLEKSRLPPAGRALRIRSHAPSFASRLRPRFQPAGRAFRFLARSLLAPPRRKTTRPPVAANCPCTPPLKSRRNA
ncbi:MAG: hypothetical protein BWZ10_03515 [candidate division BRC1 bacterium ADurb.BinA364]|nr:MAG: hypothetical protein BWZ10_03515 [candidate division BRC1 bacterium ADurb.BinA364]